MDTQGKRNPSKMVGVARGHQRADILKPYSQETNQSNHTNSTKLYLGKKHLFEKILDEINVSSRKII